MYGTRAKKRPGAFLNPDLDSDSSDEDDNLHTKTRNAGASKMTFKKSKIEDHSEESEASSEESIDSNSSDDEVQVEQKRTSNNVQSNNHKKRNHGSDYEETLSENVNPSKYTRSSRPSRNQKSRKSDTEDEESKGSDSEESIESDVTEEDINDSDFMPDSDDEREAEEEIKKNANVEDTIILSSDNCDTPERQPKEKPAETLDPSSKEFWNKVETLRSKGSASNDSVGSDTKDNPPKIQTPEPPIDDEKRKFIGKLRHFIRFDHEISCKRKCELTKEEYRKTIKSVRDAEFVSPDLVKACLRVISCSTKLGDTETAREAIKLFSRLGEVPMISALCQAMISGVRSQSQSLKDIDDMEKLGLEAMKEKNFAKASDYFGKAIRFASSSIRLLSARGDCLAFLSKWTEASKVASAVLGLERQNTGALFLKGISSYKVNDIPEALTYLTELLKVKKDHSKAQVLMGIVKQLREKKEQAGRAFRGNRHAEALSLYTSALSLDPSNTKVAAHLLSLRAEVNFKKKDLPACSSDCDACLKSDQDNLLALHLKAKCCMENKEYAGAVWCLERLNTLDIARQAAKKCAGESRQKEGKYEEAHRLYTEALEVDRHNKSYRNLLREAKQQHHLATRVNYYEVLNLEKTCGDSDIKKAYFKKSKEYHPDKHANADEAEKEVYSNKFKQAKEAYETLSNADKRKTYDMGGGGFKAPPGGWYRDLDRRLLQNVFPADHPRGRGVAGPVRGKVQPQVLRGSINPRPPMSNGQSGRGAQATGGSYVRGGVTIRGVPVPGGARQPRQQGRKQRAR